MKSLVTYNVPALSTWSDKLVPKLANQEYRHAYMAEGVKTWIARQVRALREQRDWSQGDLARESGKKQSAISRIEDPDYGQLTLQTLFDLAKTYDLPLLVQFVEWQDWLYRLEDVSTEALRKDAFDGEQLAALSGLQYQTSNESLLTIYASHLSGSVAIDVANTSSVTRNYEWDIEELYFNEFRLAIDSLEQSEAQPTPLPLNLVIGNFGWKPSLTGPHIAGLLPHG